MIPNILKWAPEEPSIRAIILVGSRARSQAVDRFSDYDFSIFCTTHQPYTQDEKWLSKIGHVWACVHEKMPWGPHVFPVRLVIFEGGVKADFAFFPLEFLQALAKAPVLPPEYDRGYQVLLDKDGVAKQMAKPRERLFQKKLDDDEFQRIAREFWFEAYHVAKYLVREDLWSVKFRANSMNAFLLKMMEWREGAKGEWKELPAHGKRMRSWLDESSWQGLSEVFAHFDRQDSWRALFYTMGLFREVAQETAERLGYTYPAEVDRNISQFARECEKS